MASKRLKKKRQKQAEIKKLNTAGYSTKEIKKLDSDIYKKEISRITRNEQQKQRRARYESGWEKLGIDKKIIAQLRLRDKNPENVKSAELREIKNKQKAYRAKVSRIINNTVHHAHTHLALAFTPLHGAMVWTTAELKKFSMEQLKRKIRTRRKQAKNKKTGSAGMTGAFQIMSGSKEDCNVMLNAFEQRGYNFQVGKLVRDEYISLVNRNDWTKREFTELVLCVIAQSPNADVEHHIQAFENYIHENNLPFNDIFEE